MSNRNVPPLSALRSWPVAARPDRTESAGGCGLIARPVSRPGRRRVARLAAAATLGLATAMLATAPAFGDTVTSSTGMVTVSVPPGVVAGVASTYTLTVTNTTPEPFDGPAGVVVSGSVPSGLSVQHINGCTNLGGGHSTSFLCSMPNLAPGASESATFSIVATAIGSYEIPFGAAALEQDPANPGVSDAIGDSATLAVTAQAGPSDIQVTGSSNNSSPAVGSLFSYTFQVKNDGPLPVGGVAFDDQFPAAITVGSAPTTDNGSCTAATAANSVHCDIGNLGVGQQADITITATPTTTGAFADTATVSMTAADTHPANNAVTVTVQPR